MAKYVFSSTLKTAEWDNSTVVGGDVAAGAARLKDATSGDLLIWGHTRLAEALMRHGLVDVIDLSVHPLLAGHGGLLLREGLDVPLRLVSVKSFSRSSSSPTRCSPGRAVARPVTWRAGAPEGAPVSGAARHG